MKRHLIWFFPLILLVACNLPKGSPEPTFDPDLVATMVEETLAGFSTPTREQLPTLTEPFENTATMSPSATPVISKASGKVCFPKSGRTEMRAFFQETTRGTLTELAVNATDDSYEVPLDPGNYIAYVWLPDFSFGGMYSDGTSPKVFAVFPGETTGGIDLCDWTHGPFDVPYPPGYQPQQTTGSITGTISYPYGSMPALTVVAFSKTTPYWYWLGTAPGQSYYTISDLPPGKYIVVAYDKSGHAGGSEVVTVSAGESATADVNNWSGSYPSNPLK